MKFFIAYAVVFGLLAFEEIQAEAKIEASAAATKPFAAEQNFNLLKQFGHEDESKLDQDYLGEGSGWGDNEDDDDYDDEEYYDEDDDDYYDDDDDDLDFGSGKIIPNLEMNFQTRNLYNYIFVIVEVAWLLLISFRFDLTNF